jgi:hypothetical protein
MPLGIKATFAKNNKVVDILVRKIYFSNETKTNNCSILELFQILTELLHKVPIQQTGVAGEVKPAYCRYSCKVHTRQLIEKALFMENAIKVQAMSFVLGMRFCHSSERQCILLHVATHSWANGIHLSN